MERRSPWECDALPKLKDERIALHLSKEQILDREQSTAGRAIRRHRARRESIGCKADLAPSGYLKSSSASSRGSGAIDGWARYSSASSCADWRLLLAGM